ncbi:hypothetical protein J7L49_03740 [Candidatus Bathyarchaeota archaeon]|nr:hypothetical protein [Candidatus Bathyarchaeota archaeon]
MTLDKWLQWRKSEIVKIRSNFCVCGEKLKPLAILMDGDLCRYWFGECPKCGAKYIVEFNYTYSWDIVERWRKYYPWIKVENEGEFIKKIKYRGV